MSHPGDEGVQPLTVLTWDSHGMIHYVDAVRGAFWASRGRSCQSGLRPSTVEVVALAWNRRRPRHAIARQSLTLAPFPNPSVEVGLRKQEIEKQMDYRHIIQAAAQGLTVLFGRRVVRESRSRMYQKRPVLTFGDIQVGDLIASEYFAGARPKAGTRVSVLNRLRGRFRLAKLTYCAHLTYAKALEAARRFCSPNAVVFATEWTYTHEILSRVCETYYQAPCIYRNEFGYFMSSANLRNKPQTNLFTRQASIVSVVGGSRVAGDATHVELVQKPEVSRYQESHCDYGVADSKRPRTTSRTRDTTSRFPVVLFLHDIRDAQYECGVDGYRDMQHWATRSLAILSARSDVKLFAKPHPNLVGEPEGGPNRDFLQRLGHKFPNVHWIPPYIGLEDILEEFGDTVTVISHHGTVGYEMAQRGLVALVSGLAPYGNYPLARYWCDRQAYEDILANSAPNQFTELEAAGIVSTAAERYAQACVHQRGFVPTYRVLGSLTGNTFPEGIYADHWLTAWKLTIKLAGNIGLKACIESCLAADLQEIA